MCAKFANCFLSCCILWKTDGNKPLVGEEEDVVDLVVDAYAFSNPDSPQYFNDQTELVLRNATKVLKRLDASKGEDGFYSTFIWLERLLSNEGGQGRELVIKFSKLPMDTADLARENATIASWFMNEYFSENSKVYKDTIGLRSSLAKINGK